MRKGKQKVCFSKRMYVHICDNNGPYTNVAVAVVIAAVIILYYHKYVYYKIIKYCCYSMHMNVYTYDVD